MKKTLIAMGLCTIILTGCDQAPTTTDIEVSTDAVMINSGDSSSYSIVAPMVSSPIRGLTNEYVADNVDLENMEIGLMNISKSFADPSTYIYQAGQVITYEDAEYLLNRQLDEDQYAKALKKDDEYKNIGVNPILADDGDPAESKIYANTIIEQDYYTLDGNGNRVIDTISIAFGINPNYTYTDSDGNEKVIELEEDELINFGFPHIANNMTSYIRSLEGYEGVQIVYGFYIQSDSTTLPGNYSAYTSVDYDSHSVNKIQDLDEQVIIYPSDSGDKKDAELNDSLVRIESNIYKYFPRASGAYAYGYYTDGNLTELEMTIVIDIYSSVETEPFVSFLEAELQNSLNVSVPMSVDIINARGESLAIIYKESGGKYTHHIY